VGVEGIVPVSSIGRINGCANITQNQGVPTKEGTSDVPGELAQPGQAADDRTAVRREVSRNRTKRLFCDQTIHRVNGPQTIKDKHFRVIVVVVEGLSKGYEDAIGALLSQQCERELICCRRGYRMMGMDWCATGELRCGYVGDMGQPRAV
jgi:hypothetical protein